MEKIGSLPRYREYEPLENVQDVHDLLRYFQERIASGDVYKFEEFLKDHPEVHFEGIEEEVEKTNEKENLNANEGEIKKAMEVSKKVHEEEAKKVSKE